MAASGYDLAAVPYAALDDPAVFCGCAVRVAVGANQAAAARLGMKGGVVPTAQDLEKAFLLPNKGGSTACKAGPWRVDFTPAGLALSKNGTPVFGGEKQLIAGKTIERTAGVSQSWDQE